MSKQQKSIAENSDHESMALDENNSHDSSVSEHSTSEEEVEEMTDSEDSDASSLDDLPDDDDDMSNKMEKKRKRTRKMDNSADFAAALDRVLSMSLNQQETQVPVMAKNRVVERRLEEERLERKARKVLAAERNAKLQQGRRRLVDPDEVALTLEYEKRLKKVATRGVIQLFNAVRTHQKSGEDALAPLVVATTKAKEKEQLAKLSKASFLDRLKQGNSTVAAAAAATTTATLT